MPNRSDNPSPTGTQPGSSAVSCIRTPCRQSKPALRHRLKAFLAAAITLLLTTLLAYPGHASNESAADIGKTIYLHGMLGNGKPLVGARMRPASNATSAADSAPRKATSPSRRSPPAISYGHVPVSARTSTCLTLKAYVPIAIPIPMPPSPGQSALDQRKAPGVTDSVLHFATIITPDADPVKRAGMLDVLEKFFASKNRYVRSPAPRVASTRVMMFKVNRRWHGSRILRAGGLALSLSERRGATGRRRPGFLLSLLFQGGAAGSRADRTEHPESWRRQDGEGGASVLSRR
ncbi:MAG: putative cytochrome c family protein [Proteobacteria bacterium]|nr:putative cytochrome c family protein [Pseudomonadota bacterium]